MTKFKLSISIRKGMEDRHFDDYEIETEYTTNLFTISKLQVFKDDSYLVASLEELPEVEDSTN
jgi:hypothetical protein